MQKWIIVLLVFLAGTGLSAQTFRGSVVAGMNISQIDGDALFGFHQPGVNAGLRVVAILNDRWRVGPEILFSQQGAKRPLTSANISIYDSFRLNTLEVPLMAYYKDWRITAEGGFSYQRLINYEVIGDNGEDVTAQTDLQDNLFALKLGATIYFSPNWGLNVRWSKHILDIDVDNGINTSFKGRSVSVRAVYTFGAGESLPKPIDPE